MATDEQLQSFVKDGLARGIARPDIERVLRQAGWPPDHVRNALRGFAEIDFAIPVPRPRPYLSAREAFLYLVLFSTLYVSAFSLGALIFHFIDLALPDAAALLAPVDVIRDGIRWSISFFVVAFPIFLYVGWATAIEVRREPSKRASKVRRWLTYLTLFVASAVLFGDVIGLVYNLLAGGLTARFVLKVSTIAVITGTVVGYFLRDLRLDEQEGQP